LLRAQKNAAAFRNFAGPEFFENGRYSDLRFFYWRSRTEDSLRLCRILFADDQLDPAQGIRPQPIHAH